MRDAILRAADYIEEHPHQLNWSHGDLPKNNGGIGYLGHGVCPLAWIGEFTEGCTGFRDVTIKLGLKSLEFYDEMDRLSGYNEISPIHRWYVRGNPPWATNARLCAETLRKFADKFFPVRHEGLPESVKGIFNVEEAVWPTPA
jgi:hypothetical protein